MSVNVYNFDLTQSLKQGETFQTAIRYKNKETGNPYNLTGYTARMALKRYFADETALFELTTENGRITITPTEGLITLNISASDTALLSGVYIYDLEIVNGAYVKRLIQGKITIDLEVTT